MTGKPAGPLHGVRILDLCSNLAGPYDCTLLADFAIAADAQIGQLCLSINLHQNRPSFSASSQIIGCHRKIPCRALSCSHSDILGDRVIPAVPGRETPAQQESAPTRPIERWALCRACSHEDLHY
jgi:hypothetical protein